MGRIRRSINKMSNHHWIGLLNAHVKIRLDYYIDINRKKYLYSYVLGPD